MARNANYDGTANNALSILGAAGFTAMPYGTVAACVYSIAAASARLFYLAGTVAQDGYETYRNSSSIAFFVPTGSSTASVGWASNVWSVAAMTKPTGSNTGRGHYLNLTSGGWTHANGSNARADSAVTGLTEHQIGYAANTFSFDGHVAAVAVWRGHAMSDGEIEQLASGRWAERGPNGPDLLVEFPSGRDQLTRTTVDCGRNRMRQTGRGSTVTLSNMAGPPGFRFSALNRRR